MVDWGGDAYNILLTIEKIFSLYAMHRRPLPACHKDTLRRLALVWMWLNGLE